MEAAPDSNKPGQSHSSRTGRRLVVYAGPTGGHIFPAQSFSEGFRGRFPDSAIALVTCHRAKALVDKMPQGIFCSVTYLPEFGFPAGFSWKTLKPFFLFPYLLILSFFFLKKNRPDLCVGFGSFVSYPGMMAAHWMKMPTLIHEQNKVPGKATQWLLPHMDVVAESFEGTRFLKKPKSLHTVGLPLRSFMAEALARSGPRVPRDLFTVLIVGGSQGAKGLNSIVVEALSSLTHEERSIIAVIHIAGHQDQPWVFKRYQKLSFPNQVYPFCSEMDVLLRGADLAITRAGASTLFELAAFGVPALVIPYPHAGGHQKHNAESFSGKGGLIFHDENPEAIEWLAGHLREFMRNPAALDVLGGTIKKLAMPNATEELVKIAGKMMKPYEDRKR